MLMGGGGGGGNDEAPAPEQPAAPTALQPVEPLEMMTSKSMVDVTEADQQAAMKQQERVNKKASPGALSNTGLQIGADYGESE
jgi:hypothetical protein